MKSLIPLLFLVLFIQCHSEESSMSSKEMGDFDQSAEEYQVTPPRTAEPPPPPEVELEKGSKLIKEGRLEFEVSNLNNAKNRVDTLLKSLKGYYQNEQFNSYNQRKNYSLIIRIPNQSFDTLILLLEQGKGKLKAKNILAKDVTEEFVDLNIRLKNNLAYLDQYNELLKKAKTINEILEIKERNRIIESDIESNQGRLKYLEDKVKYSTINLELNEMIEYVESDSNFIGRIKKGFKKGFDLFLDLIVLIVNLWPFVVLMLLGWMIIRRKEFSVFGRRNNKKNTQ